jgi:hypothetical protein
MRVGSRVTTFTLAVSLWAPAPSLATAPPLSSTVPEDAAAGPGAESTVAPDSSLDGTRPGAAAGSIVAPESSLDGKGPAGGPSTADGLDEGGAGPEALGLRLEVDASGQLVPRLSTSGLLADERACEPVADTCAGPTGPGASDRLRAIARDLSILALFTAALLALARAIRRLS